MDPNDLDFDDFPMSIEYENDEDDFPAFDRDSDWAEDHAWLGEIGERYMLRHLDG